MHKNHHKQGCSHSRLCRCAIAARGITLPRILLFQYSFDGTRIYFRCWPHNLGRPVGRPELSLGVWFVVPTSTPNIQKKSLEEKGVNIQIGLFSSQNENLVNNSIYKNHTNRYLTATNHFSSRCDNELTSDGVRWLFHGTDRYVNSWWRAWAGLACGQSSRSTCLETHLFWLVFTDLYEKNVNKM